MAFKIEDYHDLVQLLTEHPEWKSQLRGLILSEEFLTLPAHVRELSERQQRTEETVQILTEQVQELTAGQRRLTDTVQVLTEQVQELITGQRRLTDTVQVLTEQVQELTAGQRRLTNQGQELTTGQRRLTDTVGRLQGRMLEMRYRERVGAYFGRLLRRPRVVDLADHVDALESALASDDLDDVFLLDLVVSGPLRQVPEPIEVWLAMEISSAIDERDVDRVVRRTNLLRRAGYLAIPMVAGEYTTEGTEAIIQAQRVVLLEDGRVQFWEDAVSNWVNDD